MIGTFLLNGLLISTMAGYIDSREERWLSGKIRYSKKQFMFKKYDRKTAVGTIKLILSQGFNIAK